MNRAGGRTGVRRAIRRRLGCATTDAGFTLVEMVVATTVVLLMIGAALVAAPGILQQARQSMCDSTAESIQNAITGSFAGTGDYSRSGPADLIADEYLVSEPASDVFTFGTATAAGVTVIFGEQCSDDFVPAIWAAYVADDEYAFGDGGLPPTFAPSATTALIGTPGDTEVELSWTAPTNDGGSPLTGYSVLVSQSENSGFAAADGCTGLNGSTTTCTAVNLVNGTLYYFRVAAVNAVGTGAYAANSFTPVEPLACDQGGECEVGELGPGGGYVFYDAGSDQPWGRYLEAAPAGWNGSPEDPKMTAGCQIGVESPGLTQETIGSGADNTVALVSESSGGGLCTQPFPSPAEAAIAADDYTGGGQTDWYLPSRYELNQLCRWASGQSTGPAVALTNCSGFSGTSTNGGFVQDNQAPWTTYISSSLVSTMVYLQMFAEAGSGVQMSRTYEARVRPIRAF